MKKIKTKYNLRKRNPKLKSKKDFITDKEFERVTLSNSTTDNHYNVKAIHSMVKDPKNPQNVLFLVEWEGFPEKKDWTYEPICNFPKENKIIKDFIKSLPSEASLQTKPREEIEKPKDKVSRKKLEKSKQINSILIEEMKKLKPNQDVKKQKNEIMSDPINLAKITNSISKIENTPISLKDAVKKVKIETDSVAKTTNTNPKLENTSISSDDAIKKVKIETDPKQQNSDLTHKLRDLEKHVIASKMDDTVLCQIRNLIQQIEKTNNIKTKAEMNPIIIESSDSDNDDVNSTTTIEGFDRSFLIASREKQINCFNKLLRGRYPDQVIGPRFSSRDPPHLYESKKLIFDSMYKCQGPVAYVKTKKSKVQVIRQTGCNVGEPHYHVYNFHSKKSSPDKKTMIFILNYSFVECIGKSGSLEEFFPKIKDVSQIQGSLEVVFKFFVRRALPFFQDTLQLAVKTPKITHLREACDLFKSLVNYRWRTLRNNYQKFKARKKKVELHNKKSKKQPDAYEGIREHSSKRSLKETLHELSSDSDENCKPCRKYQKLERVRETSSDSEDKTQNDNSTVRSESDSNDSLNDMEDDDE